MESRKQRAKAPKKTLVQPRQARAKENNYFHTMMKTEEGRALRRQWATKPRKNGGRPKGVPDGHTKESIAPFRAEAKQYAKRMVELMAKEHNIEDDYQREALETAVSILRLDGETRERLAAARLVLDFTKSKPVAKTDVSISKAEDFLSSLLVDEEKSSDEQSTTGYP